MELQISLLNIKFLSKIEYSCKIFFFIIYFIYIYFEVTVTEMKQNTCNYWNFFCVYLPLLFSDLSEIPCIKKSLSSTECSSFSSNAISFLFYPLCGQRNEISFRSLFSSLITKVIIKTSFHISQIKGLLFRFFPHAKGTNGFPSMWFWFFVISCRRRKRIVFFFIRRKLKYQLSLFFLILFWKIKFTLWLKL